ncbi:winged helix-turn-helix transcriptional regulator [Actinoplanes sp. NPDC020271]|uniref:winged helix-turn-helix transcriptional regulator n=1 Tax=Actinoplanes sp. NPDC020271 TaxID=3363896 RepID=UPI00378D6B55
MTSKNAAQSPELCSMARALGVVGDRWSFLILREAMAGARRFSEFRAALGISTDILTSRLSALVGSGVLERRSYQQTGSRTRDEYVLTPAGRQLAVVLASLQQWGDVHVPGTVPSIRFTDPSGQPVRVGFLDGAGNPVEDSRIQAVRPRP